MRTLAPLLLGLLAACASGADVPGVYRRAVRFDEPDPAPGWKEGRLEREKLPRYPVKTPERGDFVLYWVERTYDGQGRDTRTAAYLLLDYVSEVRDNGWAGTAGRVYGESRDRWGELIHRGLTRLPGSRARHCPDAEPWPGTSLGSFDGASLSVENLTYLRSYAGFPGRHDEATAVAFHPLGPGRRLFGLRHRSTRGPMGGEEWYVLSDAVPVRGLLRAYQDWSTSSGLHNHTERITLLNQGRLTPAELEELGRSDDVLPSERALWERLSQ